MELIRGRHNLSPRHRGCVASIGNFDGVHRGHRAVIEGLARKGREMGLPVTVVTFEPHPQDFFRNGCGPPRIMGFREKLEALGALGVERVLCLRFGRKLASLSARDFIRQVLVDGIGVRYLAVGDDFRFGRGRGGDFQLLCEYSAAGGFTVAAASTLLAGAERISSSLVRKLLAAGDLEEAARLMGRPLRFSGRVMHGAKRGRGWGWPTANLSLKSMNPAVRGVFAVEAEVEASAPLPAVANIGRRPTVDSAAPLVEVHILDYVGDLYGRRLRVTAVKKLRDEKKFPDSKTLRAQIARDAAQARAFFALPVAAAAGAAP